MVEDDWNDFSARTLDDTGTLLFGRKTYEGFRAYWSAQSDPIAERINAIEKVVVSATLTAAGWTNARLLGPDLEGGVRALKAASGKDIVMYGSGQLAPGLTALGLIDEYRLAINPVVLGAGLPLFRSGAPRLKLRLTGHHIFRNGVIFGFYRPVR
jgi:dihydrofolate reductase